MLQQSVPFKILNKLVFAFIIHCIAFSNLQAQHTWVKSFPKLVESGTAFEASDGYLYIAGKTSINGNFDVALTKLNQSGEVVWSKAFGGAGDEWSDQQSITELNGNITLVVNSNSFNTTPGWDILCMTLDTAGNLIRQKNIGGNNSDPVTTIQVNANKDGYIIGGATLSNCSFGANDHYVLHVDTFFNVISTNHYGTFSGETWSNFELFSNKHIVVAGVTNIGPHPWNGNIIYTDASGNVLWAKYITGAGQDVVESNDHQIVTVGGNTGTLSLLKIDLNGNVVFAKNILPGSWGSKIVKTKDRGYAIIGSTNSYSQDGTQSDVVLVKLDSNFNTEWAKTYGAPNSDEGSLCFFEKKEGGYFILSSGTAWGTQALELVFISTDSKGNTFCKDANLILPAETFYNPPQGNIGGGSACNFIAKDIVPTKAPVRLTEHLFCINCTGANAIQLPFSDTLKVCTDSTVLDPGVFASYRWNTTDTNRTLVVKQTGLYVVSVTNAIGCKGTDSVHVLFDRAHFTLSDSVVCASSAPIQLIPDRNTGMFWGSHVSGNRFVVDSLAGNYTVYYVIQNQFCSDTTSKQIVVKPKPSAQFYLADTLVCSGSKPVPIYLKEPGGLLNGLYVVDEQFSPDQAGLFTIRYVVKNDFCSDTVYQNIRVLDAAAMLVPNVFSPNNDDNNDIFKPVGVMNNQYQLQIYNRWGQLLFETTNPENGWDGNYLGEPASEGVYFYIIKALDACQKSYNLKGTVQLLK